MNSAPLPGKPLCAKAKARRKGKKQCYVSLSAADYEKVLLIVQHDEVSMEAAAKQVGVNPTAVRKRMSMKMKVAFAAHARHEAELAAIRAAFISNVVAVLQFSDKYGKMIPSLDSLRKILCCAQHMIDLLVYSFTNVTVSIALLF